MTGQTGINYEEEAQAFDPITISTHQQSNNAEYYTEHHPIDTDFDPRLQTKCRYDKWMEDFCQRRSGK